MRDLLVVGRAGEHVADGQVDLLGRLGDLLQAADQPAVAVGEELAG